MSLYIIFEKVLDLYEKKKGKKMKNLRISKVLAIAKVLISMYNDHNKDPTLKRKR
jgi:hypothetical protein